MKSKVVAVAYALLMFTSALPVSEATHATSLTPDVPALPHVTAEEECLPSTLPEEILIAANQLVEGDPAWYRDQYGVPALCVQDDKVPEWTALIVTLDAALQELRNASAEVQRQVDMRTEHTLPDSSYPNDLVEPRTVLLEENFDGRRITGFGSWQVVTEKGEDEVFRIETRSSAQGTSGVYRFGDDAGYPQGVHQWLISPEIDLTALAGNRTAVRDLEYIRSYTRNALWQACNDFSISGFSMGGNGQSMLAPVCGENGEILEGTSFGIPEVGDVDVGNLATVVKAYELAIDSTVYTLPVMQHGAFMDLTYRVNMAPGEDGVRLWIYSGDRAPDRRELYDAAFGADDAYEACLASDDTASRGALGAPGDSVNETLRLTEPVGPVECTPRLDGGKTVPDHPMGEGALPGMRPASTFTKDAPMPANRWAFSGNLTEFTTARINLTDHLGDRIWVLFEVKTQRNDRGVDIFDDRSRFSKTADYGFELSRVYVEGDAYHRNLRIKAIGGDLPYMPGSNAFGDDRNVRLAIPPGNEPLTVWVHNAGEYVENATLTVTTAPGVASRTFETRLEMIPDEVRSVKVPWGRLTGGGPLQNKTLYTVSASLESIVNSTPTLVNITREGADPLLDPNVTAVRPANAADLGLGGTTDLDQAIRANTARDLTLIRADGGSGNPIELCSRVNGIQCTEHYAGRKGEERKILVGIRNDGNAAQDASVLLKLELDGVEHPEMIVGGPVRTAPDLLVGELRSLEWSIIPTLPGAYRVILVPQREGQDKIEDPIAERRMFVQRSTGLVCIDTLEARECGPTWEGGFVPLLKEEPITASALGPDGTLYVATASTEERPEDGVHTGMLAARDPTTGAWRLLANLSATRLNETFPDGPSDGAEGYAGEEAWGSIRAIVPGDDGELLLYGDNGTSLVFEAGALRLGDFRWVGAAPHYRDALLHATTLQTPLVAVGSGGLLEVTTALAQRVTLRNTSIDFNQPNAPIGTLPYTGTFRDLAVGPTGRLAALGEGGVLFVHNGSASLTAPAAWTEAKMDGRPLAWVVGNATTLHAAAAYDGRLFVAGEHGTLLVNVTGKPAEFRRLLPPPPVGTPEAQRDFVDLFVSEGRLHLLDADGQLASCAPCAVDRPAWAHESLPLPVFVPLQGAAHPARLAGALDSAGHAVLLGEGGLVLDRIDLGDYNNTLSWTTVPPLAPRDGGVISTRRYSAGDWAPTPESYIGVPAAEGRAVANEADSFRIFLNHSLLQASPQYPASLRLLYRPVYDTRVGGTEGTRICDIPEGFAGTSTVCTNPQLVRLTIAEFEANSTTDGWESVSYTAIPDLQAVANLVGNGDQDLPTGLFFYGVELHQTGAQGVYGVRWAIDDVSVQGRVGGAWKDVISWRGLGPEGRSPGSNWWNSNLQDALLYTAGTRPTGAGIIGVEPKWVETESPFEHPTESLWHYTDSFADRPVFAANNEFYGPEPSPSKPRIPSEGNWRLISPILDLRDAYDPQLVFRHAFSFRTLTGGTEDAPTFKPGDGGTVEVQYLKRGPECGSADLDVTCGWSPFYTVRPDAGYPDAQRMGFGDATLTLNPVTERTADWRVGPGLSFWGRQASPDERGEISATRDTRTYEEVKVTFEDAACNEAEILKVRQHHRMDCVYGVVNGVPVVVNLTGRQVRVAFHFHALTHADNAVPAEGSDRWENVGTTTFPGEGWYITDIALRGAAKLGIDLRATDLTLAVGYDVDAIGVGPGTRIPVEVEVQNNGVFDALGYTGKLEVRKVLDTTLGTSVLVDTVSLPQQAVLDAGGKRTHTVYWTVPREEDARYALRFEVVPVGIDRDESFLDNVATIGSVTDPITARTVRRFHPEFLVSPENATADITRYIPMFLNNTGNVPLEGFTVERRITQIGTAAAADARDCTEWRRQVAEGRASAIVDCREWSTTRPVPEGTRIALTLVSDDVDPSADLFWKAPTRASFLIALAAETRVGSTLLVGGTDKRVNAFATYLFDDVESGTRGDAFRGAFDLLGGWNVTQPGFRSTDAYAFGDATLGRYPADADASLVTPTLEIGSARTARVAWYQKYDFEESFDGGVVEGSVDGGRTWSIIEPISDPLASAGYDRSLPIQASSAIHATGDPEDASYGFTGDSALLDASTDGWVLTQLDLTRFSNVTEPDVAYKEYTSIELGAISDRMDNGTAVRPGIYRSPSWCEAADDAACWETENITESFQSPLSANDPANEFWWSGSPRLDDDGARVLQNYLLEFEIDVSEWSTDERVIAEWWEYASRFGARSHMVPVREQLVDPLPGLGWANPDERHVLTAHTYLNGANPPTTWRFNLSEPQIIETKGKWHHMQSDITELVQQVREKGDSTMYIRFAYTPIKKYSTLANVSNGTLSAAQLDYMDEPVDVASGNYATNATDYFGLTTSLTGGAMKNLGRYQDDPGFAIDGLKIEAQRSARGQVLDRRVLLSEASGWNVKECGIGSDDPAQSGWADPGRTSTSAACMFENAYFTRANVPAALNVTGRTWSRVGALPGYPAGWHLTAVRDQNDATKLATGEDAFAWWTGDIECRRDAGDTPYPCPGPGAESRLITPAVDLGTIAGDNAAFTFWQRYGFFPFTQTYGGVPLNSGGVVEIQEFNPQTNTWSPWKQLYADDPMRGYSAITSTVSRGQLGVLRGDAPFESHENESYPDPIQYMYSGNSHWREGNGTIEGAAADGWVRESFDVTEYLGKRVRFGFHYAVTDWPSFRQADDRGALSDPDGNRIDEPDIPDATNEHELNILNDRSGWWIGDVKIVGDVLVGKPIQLRWRAATDGNVHDGGWAIDDLGIFGSRYKENLGIFVDTTAGAYGAYENSETVIPVTIRNLGESVRRDLVLEVIRSGATPVTFHADAPAGNETIGNKYYVKGITLAPGQSTTVDVKVRTRAFGSEPSIAVIFRLKELSPTANEGEEKYATITGNEVQGLLQRQLTFSLQKIPAIEVVSSTIRQVTPDLNDPVEMELVLRNPGFGPSRLAIECTAATVTEYADLSHPTINSPDSPIVAERYPCTRTGALTVAAKSEETHVFRAVPTKAGFLTFDVDVAVTNGSNLTRAAGIAVGVPPFTLKEDFGQLNDVLRGYAKGPTPGLQWSYLRGHDEPGALLLGVDENETRNTVGYTAPPNEEGGAGSGCGGPGVCRARTEVVDLHNYTDGSPAFLSFWHMDRFAKHDGAQVRARVLLNEQRPNSDPLASPVAWSEPCIIRPLGDYEGAIEQRVPIIPPPGGGGEPDVGDVNGVFVDGTIYPLGLEKTGDDFFVSPGGRWEETWSLAVFDLSDGCKSTIPGRPNITLVGHTVSFEFDLYTGAPTTPSPRTLNRGLGHGWLIDDVVVSPYALAVRPEAGQRASMLDNSTKSFNVIVTNLGATPDVVRLEFDAANSSAPEGSVSVPADAYFLGAGESLTLPAQVTLPRDPSLLPTEFKARVLARSTIDRNAVGSTLLELAFAPRQWAELSLVVTPPGGIVQEGTDAFIPITLENVGLVESVASRILVVDEWAGGRTETSLDLASIPSYQQDSTGAVRVIEFRWRPAEGSVGPHTLTFEVDPDVLGEEYTRDNNRASLDLSVSDLLIPDLDLDSFEALTMRNAVGGTVSPALDADVARYEVTAGEIVSFDVKVSNPGRAGATNVDVRAFLGSLSLPAKQVPYIAPGSEVVVTFVWLAQKGEYEIEFLARGDQVELSVDNNRYPGVGVTLLTVKGYEVKVDIPDLATLLEPGTETTFAFSITNDGNAGEDLLLRATSPAGTRVLLPREGFFLRPGETYAAEARLLLDAEAVAGEQFISIDAVARENPMKVASGRAAMRVNASYGGSIAGGVGLGAPTEIELPVELVNEGNSLAPWKLRADLPAGWTTKERLPLNVSVPPHDRRTVTLHVVVPATTAPGDRVFRVAATMPNGEVREAQARIQVSPMRAAAVTVQETAPIADRGALRVPIEVENKGNVKAPFSVVLTNVPAGVDLRVTPDTFDLEPGAKMVAALVVRPDANVTAGTYAITGYTRFEGVVAATQEGLANVQTLRLPIVRQDIALGALESTPRAGVQPGDRVSVKVPVHNRGLTALTDLPVHLFVDDVFVAETTIPTLAAGARADATFEWTAQEGIHTLTAVVDPYEDTVDGDRADNAVSQLATVGVDVDPTGAVAADRANTPGLGLVGLLAALAVGVLLTRGNGSRRQRR